ncbi:MAG TPA: class I SAM-dependent methyltransferase, partial [Tepidisphaeraceae bacterium]|nr:class I SAM-dependent methyltransferase [Tepidisphaeraceae bacterium]
ANDFERELLMPATERLLALRPGERVLDACCGNGKYARRFGRIGANVVGFDGSEAFVDIARKRTTPEDGAIAYHVADAWDERAVRAIADDQSFDAALCSMALMDLPGIAPLLGAIRAALRPGGRFVFSVSHPCFNSNGSTMIAELINRPDGGIEQLFGVRVMKYLESTAALSNGILNQPEPNYVFHRPLGALLTACFAAGFVMDAIQEPAYPPGAGGAKNAFTWKKRPQIPPVLLVRLR